MIYCPSTSESAGNTGMYQSRYCSRTIEYEGSKSCDVHPKKAYRYLQRYEGVDHVRSTVRDSSMLLVITFEVFKMISVNVSSSIVTFDY